MNFETTTELMQHQREGVAKLLPSRIGGLFAEMGLGKSRMVIELAKLRRQKIDHVIWFCPVSLKRTVMEEIGKHTDCLAGSICVFDDKISEKRIPEAFWYICGIESMSASNRIVLVINRLITERTFVIVDEASYIKGHRARRTERLTNYAGRARYRLILTGTPLTNGVVDLYAQMKFLSPRILGYRSFYGFARNHLEYHPKYPRLIVRALDTERLAAKIAPYVYQITKAECLDLPEKIYKRRYFSRTLGQIVAYEQAKQEILESLLDGGDFELMYAIFRLFTALQQITCGFWSRREDEDSPLERVEYKHRRLDTLIEILREIPEREKVIIWAKYQYDIEGIGRALAREFPETPASFFHGKLNERQRNREVERFRGDARFFVATPSCGGHGLTLNEAAFHVFYNNSFKYSERLQAEDRSHRIGQSRSVIYFDIICDSTIDERIIRALSKKEDVAESFRREVESVKKGKLKERLLNLL